MQKKVSTKLTMDSSKNDPSANSRRLLQLSFLAAAAAFLLSGCGSSFDLKNSPDYKDFSDLPFSADESDTASSNNNGAQNSKTKPNPTSHKKKKTSVPSLENGNSQNPSVDSGKLPYAETPPTSGPQGEIGVGSVYYMPVYGEKRKCEEKDFASLKDEKDKTLATLCKYEVSNCAMQGSCFYVTEKEVVLFAYRKMVRFKIPGTQEEISQPRFTVNKELERCPQGMGVKRICLDPYRSVAADPAFHKTGDVIYMPLLKGQKLPNGETHDGYLIIRDTGGAIKGKGRFDFFIGFDDYRGHLYSKLNLSDKNKSTFLFYRVEDELAEQVRAYRKYPLVPDSVKTTAHARMLQQLGIEANPLASRTADIDEAAAFYMMKWQ